MVIEIFNDLHLSIPISPARQRTFFDISGFPLYENVISNWYSYFLKQEEDHGLGNLFIRTLLKLTGFNQELNEFIVEREVMTHKGNRVDLVIIGKGADDGKYVIIENKINHWVNNDLEDYWDSFVT